MKIFKTNKKSSKKVEAHKQKFHFKISIYLRINFFAGTFLFVDAFLIKVFLKSNEDLMQIYRPQHNKSSPVKIAEELTNYLNSIQNAHKRKYRFFPLINFLIFNILLIVALVSIYNGAKNSYISRVRHPKRKVLFDQQSNNTKMYDIFLNKYHSFLASLNESTFTIVKSIHFKDDQSMGMKSYFSISKHKLKVSTKQMGRCLMNRIIKRNSRHYRDKISKEMKKRICTKQEKRRKKFSYEDFRKRNSFENIRENSSKRRSRNSKHSRYFSAMRYQKDSNKPIFR